MLFRIAIFVVLRIWMENILNLTSIIIIFFSPEIADNFQRFSEIPNLKCTRMRLLSIVSFDNTRRRFPSLQQFLSLRTKFAFRSIRNPLLEQRPRERRIKGGFSILPKLLRLRKSRRQKPKLSQHWMKKKKGKKRLKKGGGRILSLLLY